MDKNEHEIRKSVRKRSRRLVKDDPRVQNDGWEFVMIEGSRLKLMDAPHGLKPSSSAINRGNGCAYGTVPTYENKLELVDKLLRAFICPCFEQKDKGELIFRPACLFFRVEWPIRDGLERTQLNELLNVLSNVALTASPDGWIFNLTDSTSFLTSEMRYIIDFSFLYSSGVPIRWNKNLPIKINTHSWRLSLNRLPTRFNLDRRGINLNFVRCLVCDGDIETDLHVFLNARSWFLFRIRFRNGEM
ncbi:RNA-directed DNA polymerase, eukaryota, reverse transcriptase zinc-binding domain protein [Tanacetum coccineum]